MLKKNNMKKILILLAMLMLISVIVYAGNVASSWKATINVAGEALGGVNQYDVVIGVGSEAEKLPAPPPPPEYSVKMELYETDWTSLSTDIRQGGESSYRWVIGINSRGNVGPPGIRTSSISWDPSELGNGKYELLEGYEGTGRTVVSDMRKIKLYEVTGNSGVQYFTLVYKP